MDQQASSASEPTQGKLYRLLNHQSSGGVFLIICTIISLIVANLILGEGYIDFWNRQFLGKPITLWINDGLMTIFFLHVGLQLKQEIYYGELHNIRMATLPVVAALGGMLVPALIYLSLNFSDPNTVHGAGIPVATDIAFALAVITLVGSRVPVALKMFLMALAVIDDLGAIVVIALFYGSEIHFLNLFYALFALAILLAFNYYNIRHWLIYIIGGIIAWHFMLHSGIHATISGVLLAFTIPSNRKSELSLSKKIESWIDKPVTFIILPLFALSSTAIVVNMESFSALGHNYGLGIFLGLVLGKPIGISFFSWLACFLGICSLHPTLNWPKVMGAACLGGIGFTMSIFITLLAFDPVQHADYINNAKFVILISSTVAAIIGFTALKLICRDRSPKKEEKVAATVA